MTAKDITYEATISRVEYAGTSQWANPYFDVYFEDASTARTQTDASVNYEIDNPEWVGARVHVTASPAGRVKYVRHMEEGK